MSLYFHVDLDAFFAAVEQLDHPEWREKPVMVGSPPDKRGVVSTCSYEARAFGVRSGMPSSQAWKLCPEGIFVRPRFERYTEISRLFLAQLEAFSPKIHQASIDEAYLDMSGTERLFGSARQAGQLLKDKVLATTGLTISVGAAPTAYLAKIASDWQKPNGLFVLEPTDVEAFLLGLPLKKLHGCGKKTCELLASAGITSVKALQGTSTKLLERLLGPSSAQFLTLACRGQADYGAFQPTKNHSISAEITFEEDTADSEILTDTLLALAHEVMHRCVVEGWKSRTPHLKLRTWNFSTKSAQKTLEHPVVSVEELFGIAQELLQTHWNPTTLVRLLGVGLSNLERATSAQQIELFDQKGSRQARVEQAVAKLEQRHAGIRVVKARLLGKDSPRKTRQSDE